MKKIVNHTIKVECCIHKVKPTVKGNEKWLSYECIQVKREKDLM